MAGLNIPTVSSAYSQEENANSVTTLASSSRGSLLQIYEACIVGLHMTMIQIQKHQVNYANQKHCRLRNEDGETSVKSN